MADKDKRERDASGHLQPGAREGRSDKVFPKKRNAGEFGTHGGERGEPAGPESPRGKAGK
jgi:hypothetical protein